MNRHEIQINPSLCIGCGQCAKDCPTSNIQLKDKKAEILEAECIMCGHCAAICPKKAVTISGYSEAAVEQASSVRLDPQKVLEVIRFRRTIRQFQETEIPAEVISQILEAGRLTHTAENKQDVTYIVIDKEKASLEQQAVKFFRRLKPVANLFSSMARRTVIDDHIIKHRVVFNHTTHHTFDIHGFIIGWYYYQYFILHYRIPFFSFPRTKTACPIKQSIKSSMESI